MYFMKDEQENNPKCFMGTNAFLSQVICKFLLSTKLSESPSKLLTGVTSQRSMTDQCMIFDEFDVTGEKFIQ